MPEIPKIPEGARLLGVLYELPTDEPNTAHVGITAAEDVLLQELLRAAAGVVDAALRRWWLVEPQQPQEREEAPDDARQGSASQG